MLNYNTCFVSFFVESSVGACPHWALCRSAPVINFISGQDCHPHFLKHPELEVRMNLIQYNTTL